MLEEERFLQGKNKVNSINARKKTQVNENKYESIKLYFMVTNMYLFAVTAPLISNYNYN